LWLAVCWSDCLDRYRSSVSRLLHGRILNRLDLDRCDAVSVHFFHSIASCFELALVPDAGNPLEPGEHEPGQSLKAAATSQSNLVVHFRSRKLVEPSTTSAASPAASAGCGPAVSNSSWISPTSCPRMSSIVITPAVDPNSSTTTAR